MGRRQVCVSRRSERKGNIRSTGYAVKKKMFFVGSSVGTSSRMRGGDGHDGWPRLYKQSQYVAARVGLSKGSCRAARMGLFSVSKE